MDPIAAKFISSMVALIIGGGIAYAGWDLFRRGVVSQSEGGISGAGFTVNWNAAGPGIGFVVLGAAIVIFALVRPMSREVETVGPDGSRSRAAATAAGNVVEAQPGPAEAVPGPGPNDAEETRATPAAQAAGGR